MATSIDTVDRSSFYQAETAAIYAGVSGSVGSTVEDQRIDYTGFRIPGPTTFTTVERVTYSRTSPASLWRVSAATDESIVGLVFIQSAQPGRATSHALDNDFVDLAV
jgi:hypothetical protein